jgi:hypothetical protein
MEPFVLLFYYITLLISTKFSTITPILIKICPHLFLKYLLKTGNFQVILRIFSDGFVNYTALN